MEGPGDAEGGGRDTTARAMHHQPCGGRGGADAGRAAAPTCHPNMHKSKRTKSTTQTQNNELSKMRPTRDLSLPLHVSSADPSRSGLNPSRYAPPLSSSSSSKANRLLDTNRALQICRKIRNARSVHRGCAHELYGAEASRLGTP